MKGEKGYASTFRDHEGCFKLEVDVANIDLETSHVGMPCDNYYINLRQSNKTLREMIQELDITSADSEMRRIQEGFRVK